MYAFLDSGIKACKSNYKNYGILKYLFALEVNKQLRSKRSNARESITIYEISMNSCTKLHFFRTATIEISVQEFRATEIFPINNPNISLSFICPFGIYQHTATGGNIRRAASMEVWWPPTDSVRCVCDRLSKQYLELQQKELTSFCVAPKDNFHGDTTSAHTHKAKTEKIHITSLLHYYMRETLLHETRSFLPVLWN